MGLFKRVVYKMRILSLFTPPHAVSNLYCCPFFPVENKTATNKTLKDVFLSTK